MTWLETPIDNNSHSYFQTYKNSPQKLRFSWNTLEQNLSQRNGRQKITVKPINVRDHIKDWCMSLSLDQKLPNFII